MRNGNFRSDSAHAASNVTPTDRTTADVLMPESRLSSQPESFEIEKHAIEGNLQKKRDDALFVKKHSNRSGYDSEEHSLAAPFCTYAQGFFMSHTRFSAGLKQITASRAASAQSRARRSQKKRERFQQQRLAISQRRAKQEQRYLNAFRRAGSACRIWWLMLLDVIVRVVRPITSNDPSGIQRRRAFFHPSGLAQISG